MNRVAVVALRGAEDRERLDRAQAKGGEIILIAPPALWATLGRFAAAARWAPEDAEVAAPTAELIPSSAARVALLHAMREGRFDEVGFAAADAAGWATSIMSRQSDELCGARIVVEVEESDEALTSPTSPGESYTRRLVKEAARQTLRDADRVVGHEATLVKLRAAGWTLGSPPTTPAGGRAPRVSVIVPHKDGRGLLGATLDSLRAQTVPVEIVIVDDGSGSEGRADVEREARRNPSTKVLWQNHAGCGAARNTGARAAAGELLLFFDADNLARPRLVEKLAETLRRRPGSVYAAPGTRLFEDGSGRTVFVGCGAETSPATLFVENTGGGVVALHRREALLSVGGFSETRAIHDDWDLWLRYAEKGLSGSVVPEVLYDYRQRGDSLFHRRPAFERAAMRFRLAAQHPTLLAAHAGEVALFAGSWLLWRLGEERRAERDQRQAELAQSELNHARAVEDAMRAREETRSAEAQAAQLRAALLEMESSTAVRTARAFKAASPRLHRILGAIARRIAGAAQRSRVA